MAVHELPPPPAQPGAAAVFATAGGNVSFETSVRAMASMGGPMLLCVLYGRPDLGAVASIGTLLTPLIGPWTYPQRAQRLSALALVMGLSYAVGLVATTHPVLEVVVVSAWAVACFLAAGVAGAWANSFAGIAGVVCVLATADPFDDPSDLAAALVVALGGLWVCAIWCLGWRAHRWQPQAAAVSRAFAAIGGYLSAIGTPQEDLRRVAARQALLAGWDAVGLRPPTGRDAPIRVRLYALLTHAQRLMDAAVSLGFARPGAVAVQLGNSVRALSLTVVDPQLGHLIVVAQLPRDADDRLRVCFGLVEQARRHAAVQVPQPQPGVTPLRDRLRDRIEGMAPVRAVQVRTAIRTGAAVAVALGVAVATPWEYGYWIALTVLMVMRPDPAATQVRAAQRALGTVLGVLVFGSLLLVAPDLPTIALAMCTVGYLMPTAAARTYVFTTALFTGFALLLIEAPQPGAFSAMLMFERVVDTLLGAGIAVLAALVVWPFAATNRLPAAVAECLRSAARVLRAPQAPGRSLILDLLSLRALFDQAAGERDRPWPSTRAFWPVVLFSLRYAVLDPSRSRSGDGGPSTMPMMTATASDQLAAALDDLADSVATGRPPAALPWADRRAGLFDITAELHAAVTTAARAGRVGSADRSV